MIDSHGSLKIGDFGLSLLFEPTLEKGQMRGATGQDRMRVARHTSHVTRHTSHVTRHTSHVTHTPQALSSTWRPR